MRPLLCLLLIVVGCGDDRPPPPRGLEQGITPMAATATPEEPLTRRRRRALPTPTAMEATPTTMEASAEEAPERDYAAELRSIAGDPSSCGELGPATADITIRLAATVTSQGVVTRGSASGAVPTAVQECLRRRIEHGRFRAPVEDAPRRISAELELTVAEAPSTMTVDTTPMFEEVGVPGTAIAGPSGMTIQGPNGQPIGGTMGVAIGGPEGTPIQGPSGRPIGAGGYGN